MLVVQIYLSSWNWQNMNTHIQVEKAAIDQYILVIVLFKESLASG